MMVATAAMAITSAMSSRKLCVTKNIAAPLRAAVAGKAGGTPIRSKIGRFKRKPAGTDSCLLVIPDPESKREHHDAPLHLAFVLPRDRKSLTIRARSKVIG